MFQALMVFDVSMIPDTSVAELDELSMDRLHISQLLPLFQDTKIHLFFKAESLIHSDIRLFNPKPEDLLSPNSAICVELSYSLFIYMRSKHPFPQLRDNRIINRSSGKRERQPNIPTFIHRQGRYMVSNFVSTLRLCKRYGMIDTHQCIS